MPDKTVRVKAEVLDALNEYALALEVDRFLETRRVCRVTQSEAIADLLKGGRSRKLRSNLHRRL